MLETFHQLREPPFGVNPDPRFLYLSRTHREAFSSLRYRIEMDAGFLAMVAQPGMGKTTLLFHLLEQLQPKARTAFIFQTQCTSSELLRHLLSEFECRTDATDPVRVLQELKSMLVAEASAGRRCVLIVDEAQNLEPEVLETIRLLSNFETPRRKLLNIVLSGQSELGEMLARAELRQLRQRLSCIVHLEKFTPAETAFYIAHRLAVAGYSGQLSELFSADAVGRIAEASEGVPRIINNLCFNALSLSYALGMRQIDLNVVEEAALDLGLSGDRDTEAYRHTAYEWENTEEILDLSATFEGAVDGAITTAEAADEIAENNSEEQSGEVRGSEERYMPAAAAPENPVHVVAAADRVPAVAVAESIPTVAAADSLAMAGLIPENKGRAGRRQGEAALARGLACLLVLLLTPAIDWPASHSVSAQSIESASNTESASATNLVIHQHGLVSPQANFARVSHRRYRKHGRKSSLEQSRRHRGVRVPVDLELASFVPEPLLKTQALEPMPLSARMPDVARDARTRAPLPASGGFDRAQRTGSTSHYIPPKPVWQPAPNDPAWYRHPKEDVQLLLSISRSGEVSDVGILRGGGTLAYAAKRAAGMWRYRPAFANGKPVSSKVVVTIQFLQH